MSRAPSQKYSILLRTAWWEAGSSSAQAWKDDTGKGAREPLVADAAVLCRRFFSLLLFCPTSSRSGVAHHYIRIRTGAHRSSSVGSMCGRGRPSYVEGACACSAAERGVCLDEDAYLVGKLWRSSELEYFLVGGTHEGNAFHRHPAIKRRVMRWRLHGSCASRRRQAHSTSRSPGLGGGIA